MKFFSRLTLYKNRLTHIGKNEPLNFLSVLLIIALDIFVIFNIFQGLGFQGDQLTSPSEIIPYDCLSTAEDFDKDGNNKNLVFESLEYSDYYYNNNYKYNSDYINRVDNERISLECQQIFDLALLVHNNDNLRSLYIKVEGGNGNTGLRGQLSKFQSEIDNYEENYDTMLLERIADQPDDDSIIEGKAYDVKSRINILNYQITGVESQIKSIEEEILEDDLAIRYLGAVEQNRDIIIAQNSSLRFWYPLKKIGIEFIFLVPLLIFFFYLHSRSLKKDKEIQILVYSHLLSVVSFVILFEIGRLLLDIIPFHFLEDLLELLESLGLVVIWNYLLIIFGIALTFLLLIYIVQKKLFSRQRTYYKRIANKQCYVCGARLNNNEEYCYRCGENQFETCPKCSKKTFINGEYCIYCGYGKEPIETKKSEKK